MAGGRSASPIKGRTTRRNNVPVLPPLSGSKSLPALDFQPSWHGKRGTKLKMLGRMKRGSIVSKVEKVKTAAELAAEWKERQAQQARRFKPRPAGNLSDEQLSAARKAFAEIDRDSSGSINVDELIHFFKQCGKVLSQQEVKDIIEQADRSMDNRIDMREFLDFFVDAISPGSQKEGEIGNFQDLLEVYGENGKLKKGRLIELLNEQYDLQVDSSYIDGLMKEAWKQSAKAELSDLEEGLDDLLTLDELKQALLDAG